MEETDRIVSVEHINRRNSLLKSLVESEKVKDVSLKSCAKCGETLGKTNTYVSMCMHLP
jgi:hypothetical protein